MRVKKSEGKRGGGVVWLGSAAVLRASVRRPSSLGSGQSEREKQVVHEKNRPPQRCPSSSTAKTAGVHAASNRVAARLQIGFQDVKREKKKKRYTATARRQSGSPSEGIGISSHPCARASPLCTGAVGVCQLGAITGKNSGVDASPLRRRTFPTKPAAKPAAYDFTHRRPCCHVALIESAFLVLGIHIASEPTRWLGVNEKMIRTCWR